MPLNGEGPLEKNPVGCKARYADHSAPHRLARDPSEEIRRAYANSGRPPPPAPPRNR